MEIPGISPIFTNQIDRVNPAKQTAIGQTEKITQSFGDVLNALNQSQASSDDLVNQLSAGGNVDLGDLMITANENDVNFRITTAIRDRLVDAYREVMRMSI